MSATERGSVDAGNLVKKLEYVVRGRHDPGARLCLA
jgi:hypothetical protein